MFQRLRHCGLIALTLLIAAAAGGAAAQIHTPLPWMLGPLFAVALLRISGLPLVGLSGGRQAGQWAIGTALGLYFTPQVLAELGQHSGVIVLMASSAVLLGLLAAWVLERWGQVSAATAFFAGLPGGASEMVVLAERHGGAVDRIAAAHALRVMLVVSTIPFVLHHGSRASAGAMPHLFMPDGALVELIAVSLVGVAVLTRLRVANAWVLGPLLLVGTLTAANQPLGHLPSALVNAGQLLLGTALGLRFAPGFFRAAPRFLAVSTVATGLTLGLCGLFSWALSLGIGLPVSSLLLAASPGGMAEMSITARELHLSVPLVTATHVLRVLLLTVCAPLLCQHYLRWRQPVPR